MKDEPINLRTGRTISEEILLHAGDLEDNGSGLWNIVSYGKKYFGLEGDVLTDFIRRVILVLLAHGGRPVVAHETKPIWIETFQYGIETKEIADNVIAEWISEGAPDRVEWGRWWFGYPGCHR